MSVCLCVCGGGVCGGCVLCVCVWGGGGGCVTRYISMGRDVLTIGILFSKSV